HRHPFKRRYTDAKVDVAHGLCNFNIQAQLDRLLPGHGEQAGYAVHQFDLPDLDSVQASRVILRRDFHAIGAVGRPSDIRLDYVVNRTFFCDLPGVKQNSTLAKLLYHNKIMADKEYSPAFLCYFAHFAQAFLLEGHVTDGQYLVYQEYFGF